MLSDEEPRHYLCDLEADNIERTVSCTNKEKFGQAICAFANDMPGRGQTGVLFVGVRDSGDCGDIEVDEKLLQTLAGLRSDGTITPFRSCMFASTNSTVARWRSSRSRHRTIHP